MCQVRDYALFELIESAVRGDLSGFSDYTIKDSLNWIKSSDPEYLGKACWAVNQALCDELQRRRK